MPDSVASVYFGAMPVIHASGGIQAFLPVLMKAAGFDRKFHDKDFIAVKLHFGEKGNHPPIAPEWLRPVTDLIKKQGANPFLTDTCVLYKSQRDNAINYLKMAQNYGFTPGKTGAPMIIADGLTGNDEKEIDIPGQLFRTVSIASAAAHATGFVVLSHVTGHLAAGMGAAIKNLGMGFASRKGKLRQHANMKPYVSEKQCTGCEICTRWCPADAITMNQAVARIDSGKCIGCGECVTVCRFYAIRHDWQTEAPDLQKRMAEHALGVVLNKTHKTVYINFLTSVTKDCDCIGKNQTPVIEDIGILASDDPVAIDAASLDLILEKAGKPIEELAYPIDPWEQIRHGEKIGLGKRQYELKSL
ncbi:DUF362 domain-containing protein [bacterium]|nr:DUF362 domain-containing protein [bacterium]